MNELTSEFHFIQPAWFLALIPLAFLLWAAWQSDSAGSAWRRVMDARLFAVLRVGAQGRVNRLPLLLLAAGWVIAVIALANPTFERKPVPAFRADAARVVVLDLSRSMLADDLTPSRLQRARYKVNDILSRSADGQVGLVAFAGEAFTVSPLTDDADTIREMLDALSPQIMPVQGSRPDLGIELGSDLLRQAGARNGEVVLLTDDDGGARALAAAEQLRDGGHRLGVIGVGTGEGAPVPGVSRADGPVVSRVDDAALQRLARAGGGAFSALTPGDTDLERVLIDPASRPRALAERDPLLAERWQELGPWVVIVLLPLAALAFRRGWLLTVLLVVGPGAALSPGPALAFGWQDLWQRPDQRSAAAFAEGDLEQARDLATTSARAGSAAYRLGDFDDAAERFGAADGADDHYNRGNALARGGRLEDAIAAYDAALERDPSLEDAAYNRAQVKAALEEREREQQAQQQSSQSGESQEGADENAGEGASSQQPDQQSDGQSGAESGDRSETGDSPQQDAQGGTAQASSDTSDSQQPQSAGDESPEGQPSDGAQAANGDEGDAGGEQAAGAESGPNGAEQPSPTQAGAEGDSGSAAEAEVASGSEQSERAAADYRAEAAEAQAGAQAQREAADQRNEGAPEVGQAVGDGLTAEQREARQAADQWLRRIPDDPAELLRRKFLYQYQARQSDANGLAAGQPW
jgi:Ca-activated chloride channel family protein